MDLQRTIGLLLPLFLVLATDAGSGRICEDIDHSACLSMASQNPRMCADPTLASSVCPSFCGRCPLTCYNCEGAADSMSQCNTMTCSSQEMCLLRTSVLSGGVKMLRMGCDSLGICATLKKKRSDEPVHSSRDIIIKCCDRDLCNFPQSSVNSSTASTTTTTITQTNTNTGLTADKSSLKSTQTSSTTGSVYVEMVTNPCSRISGTKDDDDDEPEDGKDGCDDD